MSDDVSSISGFIGRLNDGLAKPNRFLVEFTLPKGVSEYKVGINPYALDGSIANVQSMLNGDGKINVFCHTCTLPQRSLMTHEHKQFNNPYRVPYSQQTYDPVSFSFYTDKSLSTRRYFDIWQTAVINTSVNTLNYYSEFMSDIKISVLDDEGEKTYTVDLLECYPISIGMVDLSYSAGNQLLSVIVTMSYKQWIDPSTNISVFKPK